MLFQCLDVWIFLSHGGTPSYHPFFLGFSMNSTISSFWGTSIYGTPIYFRPGPSGNPDDYGTVIRYSVKHHKPK